MKNLRIVGMWACIALFFMRVSGQILVGVYAPDWLPPWTSWYSGLIPYPLLLPIQLLLLMLMAAVTTVQGLHGSQLLTSHPSIARWLRRFAYAYALVMAIRYVVATQLGDLQHWHDGGLIPVVFHWVLASYIWLAVGGPHAPRETVSPPSTLSGSRSE